MILSFCTSTWSLRIYCYKKYSNGDANLRRRRRWMYIGEGLNTKNISLSWNNICLLSWCFYRIEYDKYFGGSKHLMKIAKSKVNLQMNKWKCEIRLCRGAEFHTKVGWIIEEFFIYFGMNTTCIYGFQSFLHKVVLTQMNRFTKKTTRDLKTLQSMVIFFNYATT